MLVGFWIVFHVFVKFFGKVKNLVFRFEFIGTVNENLFLVRELDTILALEEQIDAVNQIARVNTRFGNPKKVTGSKSGITLLEQINRAGILALYKLLNTSILKNVHKRRVKTTGFCFLNHIHRSPESVTNLVAHHQFFFYLGNLIFPDGESQLTLLDIEVCRVHLFIDDMDIFFSKKASDCRFVFHHRYSLPYTERFVNKKIKLFHDYLTLGKSTQHP